MAERNQSVAWGCQSELLRRAENTNTVSAPQYNVPDMTPADIKTSIKYRTEEDK